MTELPRSRALVLLDGPGHIMPVEPVTPAGSTVWRVVHFPVVLGGIALGLLALASVGMGLIGVGLRTLGHLPGARFLVPLLGAAAVLGMYWVFVRVVERRRYFVEVGTAGAIRELSLGFVGGSLLAAAIFAVVLLLGGVHVLGVTSAEVLAQPILSAICAAIVQEFVLRGLFFRLAERLIGSWLAAVTIMAGFGILVLVRGQGNVFADVAMIVQAGLMSTALYMVTRRLWAAVGLRAAWNLAQFTLYGAGAASAGPRPFLVLLSTGPDWLTGGAGGVASSAPGILATLLLTGVLLTVAIRRGHIVRPPWQRGRR